MAKRKTAGQRIATDVFPGAIDGMDTHIEKLARRIDAAIKRAVKLSYSASFARFRMGQTGPTKRVEKKYGVKL